MPEATKAKAKANKRKKFSRPDDAVLLRQVDTRLRRFARDRWNIFAGAFEDLLLVEAAKTKSTMQQDAYFQGLDAVRKKANEAGDALLDSLSNRLHERPDMEAFGSSGEADDRLALWDQDALDTQLNLSAFVDSAQMRHQDAIWVVRQRLGDVVDTELTSTNDPVGPLAFARSFTEPLRFWQLPATTQQMAIKCFSDQMLPRLGAFYQQLGEYLGDAGVLPDLEPEAPITRPDRNDRPTTVDRPVKPEGMLDLIDLESALAGLNLPQGGQGQAGSMPSGTAGSGPQGFSGGQSTGQPGGQWSGQATGQQGEPGETGNGLPDLDLILRMLQNRDEGSRHLPLTERARQALGEDGNLSNDQRRAAGMAHRLTESILSDSLLDTQHRDWFKHLAPVFLGTALTDQTLFENPNHPMRRVINALGQTVATAGKGKSAEKLSRQVAESLESFSAGGNDSIQSLGQLADSLEEQIQPEMKRARRLIERTIAGFEGKAKLKRARKEIKSEIDSQLSGRHVPKLLTDLLDVGWRHHMLLALIREGRQSEAWRSSRRTLETLVNWLAIGADSEMPSDEEIAQACRDVNEKLPELASDAAMAEKLRSKMAALAEQDEVAAQGLARTFYEPAEDEDPELSDAQEASISTALARLDLLETGDWLVINHEKRGLINSQLIWRSADGKDLAFVDRQGRLVAELDALTVARMMESGEARIIDDADLPLFDRAWQSMISDTHGRLAKRALEDAPTHFLNRRAWLIEARRIFISAREHGSKCCLVQVDVDRMRQLMRTLDHELAGEIATRVAERITEMVGPEVLCGRLTDRQFALCLPNTEIPAARRLAEKIRAEVADKPIKIEDIEKDVTVSIAIAQTRPETASLNDLLQMADLALEAARKGRGNQIRAFEPGDVEMKLATDSLRWAKKLNTASVPERLVLYAQRIERIDGADALPMFEMLARLRDDDGTLARPSQFLPAVETYGGITDLDLTVLETTLLQLAEVTSWIEQLEAVSINLSGGTLSDPNFSSRLIAILDATEVPTEKLILEITETTAISSLAAAVRLFDTVRERGVRVALDDFGSGLSSYGYLKRLPVDMLKIDGEFVRGCAESRTDYAMVKSIHEVGAQLGQTTVAEYVVDDDVMQAVKEIGIHYAQGFAVAKPQPLQALGAAPSD